MEVRDTSWQIRPMGTLALLIDDVTDPAGLARTLVDSGTPVVDIVPAARTVLITVARNDDLASVRVALDRIAPGESARGTSGVVDIDVTYEGADLAAVAEAVGLTIDGLISVHSSATYRVDFCGFAPGFGYMSGLPEALHLPRRATPRTRVPAGSVAIAAGYAAVYPTTSPGGWHLLGSTDAALFDPHRDPPALLTPGTEVVFRPV